MLQPESPLYDKIAQAVNAIPLPSANSQPRDMLPEWTSAMEFILDHENFREQEQNQLSHEEQMQDLQRQDHRQNILFRAILVTIVFAIIIVWLFFLACLLLLCGFGQMSILGQQLHFSLPESVVIMVLGTTTANIFVLSRIVTRHFFHGSLSEISIARQTESLGFESIESSTGNITKE